MDMLVAVLRVLRVPSCDAYLLTHLHLRPCRSPQRIQLLLLRLRLRRRGRTRARPSPTLLTLLHTPILKELHRMLTQHVVDLGEDGVI